ncbi:hypothetical protein [Pseudomonas sp. NPDC079086]|uniref:hypothetical protein n=1 Tax=unclassified Pseudomonas TaxID=196821 RepID=UPI0037C81957
MIPTPHFQSHAQQQAMLGCAANLDPAKHPRRYAQHQARQRIAKEVRGLDQENSVPGIICARERLNQMRLERRAKQAEQIKPMAATGETIIGMARAIGCTPRTILSLLDEFKITRGPKMNLEA